ncbi:hypothetical protein NDU88_004685 [Pleurodeles waltl]|uniref:Uncharacterized protein n=1 Tax=Pleurodeles waltl TaxID=8319 RepID=A0AAV7T8T8_PLEWA|nr:hypothetical protein NDU88_004685 [Pleurodeles waltl]
MLLPTHEDMDDDLVKEKHRKVLCKVDEDVNQHTKRKMDQQSARIELIMKELENHKDESGTKEVQAKMEKNLQEFDNERMERKARRFTRDLLDYQYGHIYTFARKHDRAKEKIDKPTIDKVSDSEFSSDQELSADESSLEKWDFQSKLCLLRMTMCQGEGDRAQQSYEMTMQDKEGQEEEG